MQFSDKKLILCSKIKELPPELYPYREELDITLDDSIFDQYYLLYPYLDIVEPSSDSKKKEVYLTNIVNNLHPDIRHLVLIKRFSDNDGVNRDLDEIYFTLQSKFRNIQCIWADESNLDESIQNGLNRIIESNESQHLSDFKVSVKKINGKVVSKIVLGSTFLKSVKDKLRYRFFVIENGNVIFNTGIVDTDTFEYDLLGNGTYLIQGYIHYNNYCYFRKSEVIEHYTKEFLDYAKSVLSEPIYYESPLDILPNSPNHQTFFIGYGQKAEDIVSCLKSEFVVEEKEITFKKVLLAYKTKVKTQTGDHIFSGMIHINDSLTTIPSPSQLEHIDSAFYGRFSDVCINSDEITVVSDFFNYGKVYVYDHNGTTIISNNYSFMARVLVKCGINLTLDYEKILLLLSDDATQCLLHNFTSKMDIEEIFQVSPEYDLVVNSNGLEYRTNKFYQIVSSNKEITYAEYREKLNYAADEIKSNLKCIKNLDKEVFVELTGGLDSRSVFSAITSTNYNAYNYRIITRGKLETNDVQLSIKLNAPYMFEYDKSCHSVCRETNTLRDTYWRNEYMSSNYESEYNPFEQNALLIKISGGTGETVGRPYYSRAFFTSSEGIDSNEAMAEEIWQMQIASHTIFENKKLKNIFVHKMSEELSNITGSNPIERFNLHFTHFYNSYHFDIIHELDHGTMVWMPLQSSKMFELNHVVHNTFKDSRLQLDLINIMNPYLSTVEFDSQRDTVDAHNN